MCGRYTLRAKLNLLLDQFAAEMAEGMEVVPRFNVAPTQTVLAVRLRQEGEYGRQEGLSHGGGRELVGLRWGLLPSWAKDAKIAYSTINARADTVATKPAFRAAYKKRRCLVLADGYYEWLREGKVKQPFLYEVDGGEPFAMAGLWEAWQPGAAGERIESCTILTTDANAVAGEVHDRMPVILDPEDYDAWLAGEQIPLVPLAAERMSSRPVSMHVNNVRHEGAACLEGPGKESPGGT